jgi:hypothetical protein
VSKKSRGGNIPEHILEIIRVKPEDTEVFYKENVNPKPQPPLEGKKKPKGKLWCPYCNDYKKFTNKKDSIGSYQRCESCTISNEDFHVKYHNKLFNTK